MTELNHKNYERKLTTMELIWTVIDIKPRG